MSTWPPGEVPTRPIPLDDGLDEAQLERTLKLVPRGALALAGLTVGLLMLAWLAIYFLIFLPRGMVG
jgi:hypothetical protein